MARIEDSLELVWQVEYSGRKDKALHQNAGETGWTYKGIYQTAHPTWEGWRIVRTAMQKYNGDMKLASEMLFDNKELEELVVRFYKKEFWDKMKLDEVASQKIADEMFVFGLNVGIGHAIRAAQRIASVQQDGVVGPKTIQALNRLDDTVFDETYDILEVEYYEKLGEQPRFAQFVKGWRNRAYFV